MGIKVKRGFLSFFQGGRNNRLNAIEKGIFSREYSVEWGKNNDRAERG